MSKKNDRRQEDLIRKVYRILLDGGVVPLELRDRILDWMDTTDDAGLKAKVCDELYAEWSQGAPDLELAAELWPELSARLGINPRTGGLDGDRSTRPARRDRKVSGRSFPLFGRVAMRVAAVLIPVAMIAGGYLLWSDRNADEQLTTVMVAAGDATHREVVLGDGSAVRVMPGSEIRHSTDPGRRYVELNGRAHFNVAKTAEEFRVHTGNLKIVVLGTEFQVDSRESGDYSTVDLYHGSVDIEAGERRVLMKPGEHLRFDHATGEVTISEIALDKRVYDRMPGLKFAGVPMTEVLAQVERDFGVRFTIEGEVPQPQTLVAGDLSGSKSLDDLLHKIQTLSGRFTYEIADNEVKITITR